jgi:hypothetical protein
MDCDPFEEVDRIRHEIRELWQSEQNKSGVPTVACNVKSEMIQPERYLKEESKLEMISNDMKIKMENK